MSDDLINTSDLTDYQLAVLMAGTVSAYVKDLTNDTGRRSMVRLCGAYIGRGDMRKAHVLVGWARV